MEQVWKSIYKKFKRSKECKHRYATEFANMNGAYVKFKYCTVCREGQPSLIVLIDTDTENNGIDNNENN